MLGAIIGDIVGSRFEWNNHRSKDFGLWGSDGIYPDKCEYTDDSVCTVAVADAFLSAENPGDEEAFCKILVEKLHKYAVGRMDCGFGGRFFHWLRDGKTQPYNSFGNGSAMRCSPAGWAAASLQEAERFGKLSAQVTHNHPEGILGAVAVAGAIYLARTGKTIPEIRELVETRYYPGRLSETLDEIRPDYEFDETCMGTVPQAFQAFFESTSFEDAIRNAISLGGDSDTLACITGSIAEAYYGIPEDIAEKALTYLDDDLKDVTLRFREKYCRA